MDYRPDGILVTLPKPFFSGGPDEEGWTEESLGRYFRMMNESDEMWWTQGLANKPKYDKILYCYMVYGGFVQYRLNIASIEGPAVKEFPARGGGFRSLSKKCWLTLCAPTIKAPYEIPRQGFQGFRYTQEIF